MFKKEWEGSIVSITTYKLIIQRLKVGANSHRVTVDYLCMMGGLSGVRQKIPAASYKSRLEEIQEEEEEEEMWFSRRGGCSVHELPFEEMSFSPNFWRHSERKKTLFLSSHCNWASKNRIFLIKNLPVPEYFNKLHTRINLFWVFSQIKCHFRSFCPLVALWSNVCMCGFQIISIVHIQEHAGGSVHIQAVKNKSARMQNVDLKIFSNCEMFCLFCSEQSSGENTECKHKFELFTRKLHRAPQSLLACSVASWAWWGSWVERFHASVQILDYIAAFYGLSEQPAPQTLSLNTHISEEHLKQADFCWEMGAVVDRPLWARYIWLHCSPRGGDLYVAAMSRGEARLGVGSRSPLL